MIKVQRTPVPEILAEKGAQWLLALQRASSSKERERAMNKYRHRKIKGALTRLFHGKCAYCESHITHIDYGHIEHFEFRYDQRIKLTSVYGTTARGRTTENLLGLNRPELRKYRSAQIKKLAVLKRFAETDPAARELLNEALLPTSEYSAFARALP